MPAAKIISRSIFPILVAEELARAATKHPTVHSIAEGYAIILEEVDEFWEEVRKKPAERVKLDILNELVQIGAMAQRVAEDCLLPKRDHHGHDRAEQHHASTR